MGHKHSRDEILQGALETALADGLSQVTYGRVARRLGNTPTVCRACYIHPVVLDAYLDGSLVSSLRQPIEVERSGLDPDERRVLRLLRGHG